MILSRRKVFLLAFFGVALLALLYLAGSLSNLDVTTHTLYLIPTRESQPLEPQPTPELSGTESYLNTLSLIAAILLPLSLIYLLLSSEARKRFLTQLIQVAAIVAIVYLFATRAWKTIAENLFGRETDAATQLSGDVELRFLEPFAPHNPAWLTWLISLLVAAVVIWIAYRLFRLVRTWLVPSLTPAEQLEISARSALDRLHAGENLRNVILRCYHEMTRAAVELRKVKRPENVTPREFIHTLEAAGLPAGQVQNLTRLFEIVRYGDKKLGKKEEAEAITCLNAIIASLNSAALAGGAIEDPSLGGKI